MEATLILRWLELAAAGIEAHRQELNELDAAIGDGDHGTNMARGFAAVASKLPGWHAGTAGGGEILKEAGMTLISTVGGASGPLYGTAFLRMAAALGDSSRSATQALSEALEAAQAGIAARGKAKPGEKTMLDAFAPAVAAYRQHEPQLKQAGAAAATAAEEGMRATILMVASKGRAAYLGPRSAGHQDPGATSTALLFRALAEALAERAG